MTTTLPEKPESRTEQYLSRAAGENFDLPDEPKSRLELYLAALAGETVDLPEEPQSRLEQYLAKADGQDVETPEKPETRIEQYLAVIAGETGTEVPDHPESRIEQYLCGIAENGGGGGGGGDVWATITYNDNGTLKTVQAKTEEDYLRLCDPSTSETAPITIDGIQIAKNQFIKVELSELATRAGNYFCYVMRNLQTITGTEYLQTIGVSFLGGAFALNCEINLPNVPEIPNYFMKSCT